MDEAVDGAAIRGEIGGVFVGIPEEPEQIVGELARHVVHVNPKGKAHGVVRISVQPIHVVVVVEVGDVVLGCGSDDGVIGEGGGIGGWSFVGEEVLQ